MIRDPGQRQDVAIQHPAVAARLTQSVQAWKLELLPDLTQDDRPFPLGHSDCLYTQLPARDGNAHGNIKRSNRFPNCSFFTNWTSVEDTIVWDVEVGERGQYEVRMYYTCPAKDVGSTVELAFGESRLRGQVQQAHEPSLIGSQHDRVPRQESYVKDFAPMSLGIIQLERGRGQLTLRALRIPGDHVMDLRLLFFTKVIPGIVQ